MQTPNENEFQGHKEKITRILRRLGNVVGKQLINNLGGSSNSREKLASYLLNDMRELNDAELISELLLKDSERAQIDEIKLALKDDQFEERADQDSEDKEEIAESDFSFDGVISEYDFTNTYGVHSKLCRDEDYVELMNKKFIACKLSATITNKLKITSLEIGMMTMRLDYVIGTCREEVLHSIVIQEMKFLEDMLFELTDRLVNSKELDNGLLQPFDYAISAIENQLEIIVCYIGSSDCKDRIRQAYDHIQEVKSNLE